MIPLARPIARLIWYAMLWFMRRPLIKRMRRAAPNLLPPEKREKAWRNMVEQDRWARKHGVQILTVAVGFFLLSLFLVVTYLILLDWLPRLSAGR